MTLATYKPSSFARMLMERGSEILYSEVCRLEDMIVAGRNLLPRGSSARVPLEIDVTAPSDESLDAMAAHLDKLMRAVLRAQHLVDHWSPASAVLFLDKEKRKYWTSYGAYRENCDKFLAQCLARQ